MPAGTDSMNLNKVAERIGVGIFWVVAIVEGYDYFIGGKVHLKVGYLQGTLAVIVLCLFFLSAVMFTIWTFRKR